MTGSSCMTASKTFTTQTGHVGMSFTVKVLFGVSMLIGSVFGFDLQAGDSWNQFRGPEGNGIVAECGLPVDFDEVRNVRWKIPVSQSGWSSPVIWEKQIWMTSGSDRTQELRAICVDAETGKTIHNVIIFKMNERRVDSAYRADSPHLNSPATPTPVVEDEFVYVSFGSQGIACLERKTGRKVWERRDLRIYQPVRQGSSPIVDHQNLYVAFDGNDQQFFIALDKQTGRTRWKTDRNVSTEWDDKLSSGPKPGDNNKAFATAQIITVNGKRQIVAPAGEATIAYDPESGQEIWRVVHPGGFNIAARPVYANGLVYVFTSGITRDLLAIRPDGHGDVTETHVEWKKPRSSPGIPSPVVVEGRLFLVNDRGGIARCLDGRTGEEVWRHRLGGDHWASPLLHGEHLYFSSKQGEIAILSADPSKPELVARNRLNGTFIASPAVVGSSLILRSTTHLYCLANGYQRSSEEVEREMQQQADRLADRSASGDKAGQEQDWDAIYEKLLKTNPEVRKKVEDGKATKQDVIRYLKMRVGGKNGKKGGKRQAKPGARKGSVNLYAIVIGRLRSKDIELGELEMEVDYVLSDADWASSKLVGQRVRLVGVAGPFLDNLLQIKRGETIKVRTGDFNIEKGVLGFGYKFQVLERTQPFRPADFGVPPTKFRGFDGQLVGKVVETLGYEILLEVTECIPSKDSRAEDADSVVGSRIRIAGFYRQHQEAYEDLKIGDRIRVSTSHGNPTRDALSVTDDLRKLNP